MSQRGLAMGPQDAMKGKLLAELEEERLGRLGITTEHSTAMLWQRWSRYRLEGRIQPRKSAYRPLRDHALLQSSVAFGPGRRL